MQKLLIVDGSNLLFQMFFGMPSRIVNKQGKAIQGTLGFIGALIKIIKMTNPTHLVVLFDGEHENDRTQLLDNYKANRIDYSTVSDDDNPFSQLNDIYSALDFIGIKYTEVHELEADDVIAGYAIKYGVDMEIVISSFDSDFFQLINRNVSILRYRGDKTVVCDTKYIFEKYGVLPSQYADFKSLTGDTSDNIKGAAKVGVKTAAALINQFENLQNLLSGVDLIVKQSIKESISNSAERLQINYQLIKLNDRAKLPFDIDELYFNFNGVTTTEVLTGVGLR